MTEIAIPWRLKIGLVVAGYAGVFVVAAMWIATRYLAALRDPVTFSGGMAAGGDWMLELIIVAMLLVPTFLLALFLRSSEEASTKFAKVLLCFGLSAPVSVALMAIPAIGQGKNLFAGALGYVCLYRVFAFPMTLFGLIGLCVLAKYKRARRLIIYSALVETVTPVALLFLASGRFSNF